LSTEAVERTLGIVRETRAEECRVAASPAGVGRWVKAGWKVIVERGAGELASYPDAQYELAGAVIVDRAACWHADIVVKVRPPELAEIDQLAEGGTLISFLQPAVNTALVDALAARKATVLAMDQIPRISRAQKMDALSSMANISGYRAVVEAAQRFGSFFTGQFTAAGKVPPAKVLIIGAGVAGLAALGAAKGLGAIVRAFDVRAAVADQIKSLGGEFLTVSIKESGDGHGGYAKEMSKEFIDAEYALFRDQAKDVDIVITTALIPGKPAPKLWLADMVELMKPGSVVVDMAAEQGGNCDVTVPGQAIDHKGVTVIGYTDLASRMAHVASDLYGTNLWHLLEEMGGAKAHRIDHDNDAVRPALVLEHGEKMWPAPPAKPKAAEPAAAPAPSPVAKLAAVAAAAESRPSGSIAVPPARVSGTHGTQAPRVMSNMQSFAGAVIGLLVAGVWLGTRYSLADTVLSSETERLVQHATVFVMAVFVGFQVVWNVTPALHTPLMSVTNAISGIIVVGGLLDATGKLDISVGVAIVATAFAAINIVGGFLVTRRMLAMFRK
jgi:NAD(P) transhydrogenase subunit alpha